MRSAKLKMTTLKCKMKIEVIIFNETTAKKAHLARIPFWIVIFSRYSDICSFPSEITSQTCKAMAKLGDDRNGKFSGIAYNTNKCQTITTWRLEENQSGCNCTWWVTWWVDNKQQSNHIVISYFILTMLVSTCTGIGYYQHQQIHQNSTINQRILPSA